MRPEEKLYRNLKDKRWRLDSLYYIIDKQGQRVKFRMNWAQLVLFHALWFLTIILKARQLGITTFICIWCLDECIFEDNYKVGIIAHIREDAESFFVEKVKYAWDELDPDIKKYTGITESSDTVRTLRFSNNSSIRVGTSMRSGTLNFLHVSELGKICAKYPDKAQEIVTGAFNTVQEGQIVTVESTAEGSEGYFHDYCKKAQELEERGVELTTMDWKFFFFPWWKNPEYTLKGKVDIPREMVEYFESLEAQGIKLTAKQKAWYVKKWETQQDDMKREFPSTPEEAFEAKITGCFFANGLDRHRRTTQPGIFGRLEKNRKGEIEFVDDPHGIIEIWRYPARVKDPHDLPWTNRYAVGSDIGEGLEQDYSTAYVYDRVLHELVAKMKSNMIDSVAWAKLLIRLSEYYCDAEEKSEGVVVNAPCLIVPERTGAGITTCKQLTDRNANVYVNLVPAKVGHGVTKQIGWVETTQAKYDLSGDLKEYFISTKGRIYDKVLLDQCSVFIRDDSGKLGASEGFNDDDVIAAGLALQGHYFIDRKPKQIKPPVDGWRKQIAGEEKSAWAV